ncbi:hypothetical protein CUT44_18290 [Streptomyces carminius]|uniref:Uncharacterized protein n=1 Tax=Streptomyces carminius TaxID=2665496 RepID=A0A2M8LWW1_9ACTN|nr:hypothetical protein CUT44_18290 [Streptomyces carminius]
MPSLNSPELQGWASDKALQRDRRPAAGLHFHPSGHWEYGQVSRMKHGPGSTVEVVSALGATYRGELSFIVGRAPAAEAEA